MIMNITVYDKNSAFLFKLFSSNFIFNKNAYVSFVGIFSDFPAKKQKREK